MNGQIINESQYYVIDVNGNYPVMGAKKGDIVYNQGGIWKLEKSDYDSSLYLGLKMWLPLIEDWVEGNTII